jgi:hypothetical protein
MSRNIKEIGKELLGKSLNSYHRRTGLTQLEKNNNIQDGILNGILSQIDDAYIEKTEQSNVIHLEGSGDGVVALDGIEGNTMANLCNKTTHTIIGEDSNSWSKHIYLKRPLVVGNKYTLIINVKSYTLDEGYSIMGRISTNQNTEVQYALMKTVTKAGIHTNVFTAQKALDMLSIADESNSTSGESIIEGFILLEGDYRNDEINYFEGLQSSFEEKVNDEGKYEIEILMKNKNLIDVFQSVDENVKGIQCHMEDGILNLNGASTGQADFNYIPFSHEIHLLKGKEYRLNFETLSSENSYNLYCRCAYKVTKRDGTIQWLGGTIEHPLTSYIINGDEVEKVSRVRMHSSMEGAIFNNFKVRCQLEISDTFTTYEKPKQNKIKLLLDEPLRKVNNNYKDRLCIKDGRLVVERKCGIDKNLHLRNWTMYTLKDEYPDVAGFYANVLDMEVHGGALVCDKFKCMERDMHPGNVTSNEEFLSGTGGMTPFFKFNIKRDKLSTLSADGFKTYLQQNPVTVVYPLLTPIYEEVLNECGDPILLEGYENGTVYIDSTIVPTTTVRYTPKMESLKTLKAVNDNNIMLTDDINNNIIDYMMNVDMMIMEKEMQNTKTRRIGEKDMTNMQKRTFEMLKRLIKGKTLTEQECKDRVVLYLSADKITSEQAEELMVYISEIYN